MKFEVRKGKKGEDDLVLLVCTDGYEQITYKDLFTMVKHFYDNEERVYSPKKNPKLRGMMKLLEALDYLKTHTVSETLLEFQLRRAEYVHNFLSQTANLH